MGVGRKKWGSDLRGPVLSVHFLLLLALFSEPACDSWSQPAKVPGEQGSILSLGCKTPC